MKNSKGSIAQVSLEKDTEKFKNDRVLEGSVFRFKQIFHCYSKTIEKFGQINESFSKEILQFYDKNSIFRENALKISSIFLRIHESFNFFSNKLNELFHDSKEWNFNFPQMKNYIKSYENKKKKYEHYDQKVKRLEEKNYSEKQSKKSFKRLERNQKKLNISLSNFIEAKECIDSVMAKRYALINPFFDQFLSEKFGAFKKIFESFSKLSEIQKNFKNPSEENLEARIFEEQKNITLSEMEIDKIEKCNKNIGDYHLTNQKNEFLKKITDLKKEQQNIEFYDKNIGYHQFPAKKNDCMIEILEINKTEQNTIACEKNIVDFKLPNQNNNFMNEIDKKENANVIFFDKKLKDFHYMSQKIYALKGKENLNTSNEDLANYNMNNSNDNFGVTNININENFWFNKSNTDQGKEINFEFNFTEEKENSSTKANFMKSFVKDFNKSLILPNGIHENSEQKKIDFNLNFENYPFIEIMQYDSSKKEKDPFENIDFSKVVLGQELKIKTPFDEFE